MKNIKLKIIIIITSLSIIYLTIDIYLSQNKPIIKEYQVNSHKINKEVKIIQLTDLHSKVFKNNYKEFINIIKSQSPHIITITGDMINSDDEDYNKLISLVKDLNNIAPVYFSLGNHELKSDYCDEIINQMKNVGVVVLEEEYRDIVVNNNKIRIGGVYDYIIPNMDKSSSTYSFCNEFGQTNNFKILLSHIPDSYVLWNGFDIVDADMVISGHYHGGLVRLPVIGGIFAPEQGYFPKYDSGMYNIDNKTVIISSGLGTSSKIPRINNRPEISLILIK